MARPLRIEYPGAFYHITARGNERQAIFKNSGDRLKFLSYLQSATERYLAVVHVYCLMTNHYHLLLETPLGNLSKIMHHIDSAYTAYYNVKRRRTGHLFQGRFKAILIQADSHACELSRYIHLNPVRARMAATPEEYPWSSYHEYTGSTKRQGWLTTELVLGYFPLPEKESAYRAFVYDAIEQEMKSPLDAAGPLGILGSEEFINDIIEEHVSERVFDRDLPSLPRVERILAPETVHAGTMEVFTTDPHKARMAAIHLSHRYSGAALSEIGAYFGISNSGVTQASKRFKEAMDRDPELREKMKRAKKRLGLSTV